MTGKQILKKALQKVVKNGIKEIYTYTFEYCKTIEDKNRIIDKILFDVFKSHDDRIAIEEIIFNHNFAKKFWGVANLCINCKDPLYISSTIPNDYFYCPNCEGEYLAIHEWQHHLQQMVLEKNRLKYLEKFL